MPLFLEDLKANPTSIKSGETREVTITFSSSVDSSDENPVTFTFTLSEKKTPVSVSKVEDEDIESEDKKSLTFKKDVIVGDGNDSLTHKLKIKVDNAAKLAFTIELSGLTTKGDSGNCPSSIKIQ